MIHAAPTSVADKRSDDRRKWSCPSWVSDRWVFRANKPPRCERAPGGARVTDDISKRVIFQSSPFTLSSEVAALTSARQFCKSTRGFCCRGHVQVWADLRDIRIKQEVNVDTHVLLSTAFYQSQTFGFQLMWREWETSLLFNLHESSPG